MAIFTHRARAVALLLALSGLGAAGCYAPKYGPGQFRCDREKLCPAGMVCRADGLCVFEGDKLDLGPGADTGADGGRDSEPDLPEPPRCTTEGRQVVDPQASGDFDVAFDPLAADGPRLWVSYFAFDENSPDNVVRAKDMPPGEQWPDVPPFQHSFFVGFAEVTAIDARRGQPIVLFGGESQELLAAYPADVGDWAVVPATTNATFTATLAVKYVSDERLVIAYHQLGTGTDPIEKLRLLFRNHPRKAAPGFQSHELQKDGWDLGHRARLAVWRKPGKDEIEKVGVLTTAGARAEPGRTAVFFAAGPPAPGWPAPQQLGDPLGAPLEDLGLGLAPDAAKDGWWAALIGDFNGEAHLRQIEPGSAQGWTPLGPDPGFIGRAADLAGVDDHLGVVFVAGAGDVQFSFRRAGENEKAWIAPIALDLQQDPGPPPRPPRIVATAVEPDHVRFEVFVMTADGLMHREVKCSW